MAPLARTTLMLFLLVAVALAQQAPAPDTPPSGLYQVPPGIARVEGDAVTFVAAGATSAATETYVAGLGWLSGAALPAPLLLGDSVFAPAELLGDLGITTPFLAGIRVSGEADVRIVLDLPSLPAEALGDLASEGVRAAGEPLVLQLPELLLPASLPDVGAGLDLVLSNDTFGTRLELVGPAFGYRVFALAEPTRLVLDISPRRFANVTERTEELLPGVTYRLFEAPTMVGSSAVHLLEIAPGAGEFRVVGASEEPRPLSELASGAFAAINAGYFDTDTFAAIGLLKVDYGLLSLPSRGRASLGIGPLGTIIDRVAATVTVRVDGRVALTEPLGNGGRIQIQRRAGARAGGPTVGVITVADGVVTGNTIGPRTVPEGGFALVYQPELRALALIDPGARLTLDLDLAPDAFDAVRYAVEAGPLLVADGRPAFDPEAEGFQRGNRILDSYTQQAAIGIRPDGTVLWLVAEDMKAEELVPLFLSLGATTAMRLDSGSSATLLAAGEVLNRRHQRRVVSAVVFLPHAP